ncbi:ABC transporter ATP-binding protein [Roseicella aerolata]|uniref:ABC transporter ATP-binding protein n=1 Tax=Roseicella aerolata TaxID=2883479 RepID=A0A9X1L8R2_9PROT|nr:ABC transporter ATP-binding protein [Roseicella aerolata]MCB4823361.1 ABC transporter ATP-binding protein [Roseicella aerolata]
MSDALVELRGIAKGFGEGEARVQALSDITLSVAAGEVVGLRGPSGSGKSTLLNLVACILEPDAGLLRLAGETVWEGRWRRTDLRAFRRERIGFIFQFHNLLPFLDATDNVALAQTLNGVPLKAARQRARALLDYLQVGKRAAAMPAKLSGGEAQRVAIARALANHPRIILADEPTAALDSERAGVVMDLLRQVAREQAAAVLVVTHDEKIFSRFDRLVSLRDGRIEAESRPEKHELDVI